MFFPDSWVRLGRWLIIGSALLALAACSAVRVAYDNGPSLAGLWLDRWLDLDRQQEAALEPALQRWFEWHRASELPVYAERMGRWRERAAGEVDADAVCALVDERFADQGIGDLSGHVAGGVEHSEATEPAAAVAQLEGLVDTG